MQIDVSLQVAASRRLVFEALVDLDRVTERSRTILHVEQHSAGPLRPGSSWTQTRCIGGVRWDETWVVRELCPGSRLSLVQQAGDTFYLAEFRVLPQGSAALVQAITYVTPVTALAKLTSPLAMRRNARIRATMTQDLADLKAMVEADRWAQQQAARDALVQGYATA